MQCSSQLQAYLRRLEGEEDEDDAAVEKAALKEAPPAGPLESAVAVVLECSVEQVQEVWKDELIWFAVASPLSRRQLYHELVVWLCGIASLGLIPLLLYSLGRVIKHNLARLRAEIATAQCTTSSALLSIRKIQLTCLGRRLAYPLSPLGQLPEEETTNSLGLFDARTALQRALQVLQIEMQCGDFKPHVASHVDRATSRLEALSGSLLSTHVDAVLGRLLKTLDADGGVAHLWALVQLPLQLRNLCAAVQRYQRSTLSIRRALCADLPSPSLSIPACETLDAPSTSGASGQYMEARTALLHLRTRLETLERKLWLCEKLLCAPDVLNLLVQGDAGGVTVQIAAHAQAQSAVHEAVEVLIGRVSFQRAAAEEGKDKDEDDSLLLGLAPERHDYSHLYQQLVRFRDAVDRVVSGRETSASAEFSPAGFTEPCDGVAVWCPSVEGGGRVVLEGGIKGALAVYENGVEAGAGVVPPSSLPELIPDLRAGVVDVYLGRSSGRTQDPTASTASLGPDAHEARRRRSLAQGMVRELEERIAPHAAARMERVRMMAGELLDEPEADEDLQERESKEETVEQEDFLLLRAGSRGAAASILSELMEFLPRPNNSDFLHDDE